ncbi:MAG: glycosyltransferase [Syntrophothermus sp.]
MNNGKSPQVYIALPVLNELENIPDFLHCLLSQTYTSWKLYVCINQPDEWWNDPGRRMICENNEKTFHYLKELQHPDIFLIDRYSRGKGWKGKKHGVGWARKTVMDKIAEESQEGTDIMISLDADTTFGSDYFQSVAETFIHHPDAVALSVPYFHNPSEDPYAYRAILRYEIYMRHYSINLWRIGSPYTFTALGSAMACPVRSYQAIGGMTPKMSGEDFYFLQKMRKYGRVLFWNREKVYPAARFSDRVYFGTGPAMIKGNAGDWGSYPIYSYSFFDEAGETCQKFPCFFEKTVETVFTKFLTDIFCEEDPFGPIRKNSPTRERFARACHEKVDGLRILQYVKEREKENGNATDEKNLLDFFTAFYPDHLHLIPSDFSFAASSLETLEKIRLFLVEKEEAYQLTSVLR